MDKTWIQLEQRWQLFADGPDGLFVELLKEAECELANRCSLYVVNHFVYGTTFSKFRSIASTRLPDNYKSIIAVYVNGDLIPRRNILQSDNFRNIEELDAPPLSLSTGIGIQSPGGGTGDISYYDILGDSIIFDQTDSTARINVIYKSNLYNSDKVGKRVRAVLMSSASGSTDEEVYIETNLTTELNKMSFTYLNIDGDTYGGGNLTYNESPEYDFTTRPMPYSLDISDYFNRPLSDEPKAFTSGNTYATISPFIYNPTSVAPTYSTTQHEDITILGYREVGPVINNSYHISLCDYAISVASAKKEPVISDKHKMLWEKTI